MKQSSIEWFWSDFKGGEFETFKKESEQYYQETYGGNNES